MKTYIISEWYYKLTFWPGLRHHRKDIGFCLRQRYKNGGPQVTSCPISLVTRPRNCLIICYHLLQVSSSFIVIILKDLEKIVIIILSAALRKSSTHAIGFKTLL
jgi:hypothetical protein